MMVLLRKLAVFVLLLLLAGCAQDAVRKASLLETLSGLERSPSLDPAALDDVDILALDAEAREFIDRRLAGIWKPYEKVRALRTAVFSPGGLGFALDNELTLTANETFERAGGNCVALANFFVAAARHAGINARYQELERRLDEEGQEIDDENVPFRVIERHINVSGHIIWRSRQARYVLDYLAVPEEDFGHSRFISDRRAFAHYYNNHAVRYLQENNIEKSLQYLKKAILMDADVDFVWSNLGVVYSRRGDYEAAGFAYRRSLEFNRNDRSVSRNLEVLYDRRERAATGEP